MALEPGTGADYTWHILVNALFALAESTQAADAEQLALLERAITQATQGIHEYLLRS